MSMTVSLKDDLARRLQREADLLRTSIDSVANGLLERLFPSHVAINDSELSAVVTRIRSTPTDATAIRPACQIPNESLLLPHDDAGEFNEREWNQQWADVESSMKARALLNEMTEGRASQTQSNSLNAGIYVFR